MFQYVGKCPETKLDVHIVMITKTIRGYRHIFYLIEREDCCHLWRGFWQWDKRGTRFFDPDQAIDTFKEYVKIAKHRVNHWLKEGF